MKFFSKHLFPFLVAIPVLLWSTGCRSDVGMDNEIYDTTTRGDVRITINLSAIEQGSQYSTGPIEKIKSLRLILLSGDEVELNQLVNIRDFQDLSQFEFTFRHSTRVGKKEFYFVANEESLGTIKFDTPEGSEAPQGTYGDNLSFADLMDLFPPLENINDPMNPDDDDDSIGDPDDEDPAASGDELRRVLDAVVFTPSYYSTDVSQMSEIYLPYTSTYTIEISKDENGHFLPADYIEKPMYLIASANKFYFKFVNNRDQAVAVNEISLSGIAGESYVVAHPDASEMWRGKDKKTWWIDWMRDVADNSWNNNETTEDNIGYNNLWGWIDKFTIPSNSYPVNSDNGGAGGSDSSTDPDDGDEPEVEYLGVYNLPNLNGSIMLEIPPFNGEPTTRFIGPFYIPESRYMVTKEFVDDYGNTYEQEAQEFYLTFNFEALYNDSAVENPVKIAKNVPIGNLNSLFRNTCVVITVKLLDASDASVYGEIYPWDYKYSQNGFLQEETNK